MTIPDCKPQGQAHHYDPIHKKTAPPPEPRAEHVTIIVVLCRHCLDTQEVPLLDKSDRSWT